MRHVGESIEEYGERLQEISDAQLCGELRHYTRYTHYEGRPSMRDLAEGTVLQVVMETLRKGRLHFAT